MIRLAETKDINYISELVQEFFEQEVPYLGVKFDVEKVTRTLKDCIENHIVLVLEEEDPERLHCYKIVGGICGLTVKSLLSEETVFQDIFFYIQQPYRVKALMVVSALEEICERDGVNRIILTSIGESPRLDRFYEKIGYKLLEKHYSKEI